MTRRTRGRGRRPGVPEGRQVPRSARMAELLREIVATELTRIDDDRLELITVTSIDVDAELNRAIVFFDSLRGAEADAEVVEALGQHRVRLQAVIGREIHARKTPVLQFRPDEVIRSAERIEEILRRQPPRPDVDGDGDTGDDAEGVHRDRDG